MQAILVKKLLIWWAFIDPHRALGNVIAYTENHILKFKVGIYGQYT